MEVMYGCTIYTEGVSHWAGQIIRMSVDITYQGRFRISQIKHIERQTKFEIAYKCHIKCSNGANNVDFGS